MENHVTLHEVLSKYAFGKFWVTNEAMEHELATVRRAFDDAVEIYAVSVLHTLLNEGDHEVQLRLLLSIGIDPDQRDKFFSKLPSHTATQNGWLSCVRALAPCRPDLMAIDRNRGKRPSTMIGPPWVSM